MHIPGIDLHCHKNVDPVVVPGDGDGGDDVGAVDPESRVLTTTIYLSLKNLKLLQKKFFLCPQQLRLREQNILKSLHSVGHG